MYPLLISLVLAAAPEQAPAPPQAPTRACTCAACPDGRVVWNRDGSRGTCVCGCAMEVRGRQPPSARPDGLGYCSPACRCGCQEGAPCVCGAPATGGAPVYFVPPGPAPGGSPGPVYFAPAAPYRGAPRRGGC